MRLLVYNIRYATGTGPSFHLPLPGAGYLRSNRKVLAGITEFIRNEHPDVVGLIEVDTGSIRTGMVNQAEHIATRIHQYRRLMGYWQHILPVTIHHVDYEETVTDLESVARQTLLNLSLR